MQKIVDEVVGLMCKGWTSEEAIDGVFKTTIISIWRKAAHDNLVRHISNQAENHPDYLEWMAQKGGK